MCRANKYSQRERILLHTLEQVSRNGNGVSIARYYSKNRDVELQNEIVKVRSNLKKKKKKKKTDSKSGV
jgi:hypothetical protein